MVDEAKTFMVEDAQIIFRNFEGQESQYNKPGDRNFAVILDQKMANLLERDGWPVKYLKVREEGEVPTPYISVKLGYKGRPPRVTMITSNGVRTHLTQDNVAILDGVDILTADLKCRAYNWTAAGKSGVKPYLMNMYVTIDEDELDRKYAQAGGV